MFRKLRRSGSIPMADGYRFVWSRTEGDLIQGFIEKPNRGGVLRGSGGWYRTNDPQEAMRLACNSATEPR